MLKWPIPFEQILSHRADGVDLACLEGRRHRAARDQGHEVRVNNRGKLYFSKQTRLSKLELFKGAEGEAFPHKRAPARLRIIVKTHTKDGVLRRLALMRCRRLRATEIRGIVLRCEMHPDLVIIGTVVLQITT